MELTNDEILEILKVVGSADLRFFELRSGSTVIIADQNGASVTALASTSPGELAGLPARQELLSEATGNTQSIAASEVLAANAGDVDVPSPVLGVFYRSPEPGAPPFVKVGQQVVVGDTIGLIEVMKMFSGVTVPVSGTIVQIFVEDGSFVEFGQLILRIQPSSEL